MMKNKNVCILEFASGAVRVTRIDPHAKGVRHRAMPYAVGTEGAVAVELRVFVGADSHRCRVVVLLPRAACVMSIFHFPSGDPAEVLDMAELQFLRTTPHKREDIVVDARILERPSAKHSLVAGLMTITEMLAPYFRILDQAGLKPHVVTVNAQRLVSISRVAGISSVRDGGTVFGLFYGGRLLLGLFHGGKLFFSREQEGTDVGSGLESFIDQCRKEFPEMRIQKSVLFTDSKQAGIAQRLSGAPIEVLEISSLVRTDGERAVFDLSPVAFLDLLLAKDNSETAFDLSPKSLKSEQEQGKMRSLVRQVIIIAGILLAGSLVKAGAEWHQRKAVVDSFRMAIEKNSARVRDLEDKVQRAAAIERQISERTLLTVVFGTLSKSIPAGVSLNGVELKEGGLEIQGRSEGLESVRTFLTALSGAEGIRDVRLVSIDKHPTEAAEAVLFRMKAKVQR
jgi:Tfp pilus assembly protein PilN